MSINTITSAVSDQLMAALCNTLVYSLLQGVLLAAIAGLIVVCTRKASAATRYNLLTGALLLFTAGAIVTFAMQFNHTPTQTSVQTVAQPNPVANIQVTQVVDSHPAPAAKPDLLTVISNFLNTYHNSIVLVWFLIICARCIQLATGLQGIYRLKRSKVYEPDADWIAWVRGMAGKLGIKQKIVLLESGLARVPMVIGHLKPVILIPVGLLTALSTAEIEAILMHELAHIRRRDYLVNLLQNLVEIVFFFNPAVLWVSQLIKTEREHCCDDMALAQNTSRSEYIRALVSCEEYQTAPAYAMAFPGQKNHLVDRVKRLVTNRNHSLDVFEKTLLTICLVVSGLCLSAYAEKDTIKRATHAVVAAIKHQTPKGKQKLQADDRIARLDNQTAEADSKAAELDSAEPGVPPAVDEPADTTKKATQQNRNVNVDFRTDSARNGPLGKLNGSLGKLGPVTNQDISRRIDSINNQVRVKMNQTSKVQLRGQMRIDSINARVKINTNQSILKRQAYLDSAKQYKAQAKVYAANPIVVKPSAATYPKNAYKPDTNKYQGKTKYKVTANKYTEDREQAIDEMIKDGLIKTKDNLSFKLSTSDFIINGQKQPDAVYQKYKAKYVKTTGHGEWSWMYNYEVGKGDNGKARETNTIIDNTSN